jgi:hypothetical protein
MTSKLERLHLNDFTGGLDTYNPSEESAINSSPDLDNIVVLKNGFRKRQGDVEFNATAMNSAKNVQGIGYYKPTSGTEYLLSVCGDKIYKSDSLDGTMDDITGSATISDGQDYLWTHNVQNDLSIWVGGNRNTPLKWNGTGNVASLGGTPPVGSFAFTMKDRTFIGSTSTNPSTLYWSILANPEDWSGTGSGSQTVVTNDGDELIAGIALNNDIALLFKKYSVHQLTVQTAPFPLKPLIIGTTGCCGKQALVASKGLIYFVTNEPRMKATDGYQIFDFPNTINDVWDGLNKSRLAYIKGIYYPALNQIHWYCSNGTATTNNYCIIWDLTYNCWLRYTTGHDMNVVCLAS